MLMYCIRLQEEIRCTVSQNSDNIRVPKSRFKCARKGSNQDLEIEIGTDR